MDRAYAPHLPRELWEVILHSALPEIGRQIEIPVVNLAAKDALEALMGRPELFASWYVKRHGGHAVLAAKALANIDMGRVSSLEQRNKHNKLRGTVLREHYFPQMTKQDTMDLLSDAIKRSSTDVFTEVWSHCMRGEDTEGFRKYLLEIVQIPQKVLSAVLLNNLDSGVDWWHESMLGLSLISPYVLRELLQHRPVALEARGGAVAYAIVYSKQTEAEMLLLDGPISDEARGDIVVGAAEKGYGSLAEVILADGPISDVDRGRAIAYAALKGLIDLCAVLLRDGLISDEHRGVAIANAARGRHARLGDLVTMLVNSGPFSEENRGRAVANAACGGHPDSLAKLLSSGPISEQARGDAVIQAVSSGSQEVLEALLRDGPIPELSRSLAVGIAPLGVGSAALLSLLASGQISVEARGYALSRASSYVSKDKCAVGALLDHGPVSVEARNVSLLHLVGWADHQLIRALAASGDLTQEARGGAVVTLAKLAASKTIMELLATGDISTSNRGAAVVIAAQFSFVKVIRLLLLRGGVISIQDRGLALIKWADNRYGSVEVPSMLFADGPVSKDACMKALERADRRENANMAQLRVCVRATVRTSSRNQL